MNKERTLFVALIILSGVVSARWMQSEYPEVMCAAASPEPTEVVAAPTQLVPQTELQAQMLAHFSQPLKTTDPDAEFIAKVLYGMRYNSEADLRAVVWCIINRVESPLYPDTIAEVCQQPSQWMAYSDENPVLEDLYDIADGVLVAWRVGGHRPFGSEYLWFNWSSDQITFKSTFEEGANCRYWRAQ